MNQDDFHAAYSQANLLYGLNISPENFEEIGLIAWNKIGNRQIRLYRYVTNIDTQTLSVELPCNCDQIEAVTYSFKDWNYTSNITVNGDYQSQFIEQYIEGRKLYEHPFYIKASVSAGKTIMIAMLDAVQTGINVNIDVTTGDGQWSMTVVEVS